LRFVFTVHPSFQSTLSEIESRKENLGQQDRIGALAPGKQADLVLIKGDPSKRIEEIENVETVFKAGIGYDSKKLIDSVRGQVGIR
jgi:adenine deaminase